LNTFAQTQILKRRKNMPRIELTDEIVKALTMTCPIKPTDSAELCETHCALAGACMEYWTGDDSANKEEE
jgi:hypothetical protein